MLYENLHIGDRVSWRGINRTYTGIVERLDDAGALVLIDGGGYMILSTPQSMDAVRRRLAYRGAPTKRKP